MAPTATGAPDDLDRVVALVRGRPDRVDGRWFEDLLEAAPSVAEPAQAR
ncbi:hypothetical protein [Leekyejoonella antrihumi]|nr:hypothetical protein [Leekyejoonella antrihumi]